MAEIYDLGPWTIDLGPSAADKGLQITTVLNGRNTMPPWKQLSDTELAAVIT